MGQSKGGGYIKKDVLSPQQQTILNQVLSSSVPLSQQASEGFSQFLPGGQGSKAIEQQALNRYQQQIVPSIMNQFGSNSKSSSALNQALASSGANLSTDIQALISQLGLGASQGLANLSTGQQQLGLGTSAFGYQQRPMPFWQQLLLGGVGAGGNIGGGYFAGRS